MICQYFNMSNVLLFGSSSKRFIVQYCAVLCNTVQYLLRLKIFYSSKELFKRIFPSGVITLRSSIIRKSLKAKSIMRSFPQGLL